MCVGGQVAGSREQKKKSAVKYEKKGVGEIFWFGKYENCIEPKTKALEDWVTIFKAELDILLFMIEKVLNK